MNTLPDAASYLKKRVEQAIQNGRISISFVAWLLPDMADMNQVSSNARQIAANTKQRQYRDVAELAFANQSNLLDGDGSRALFDGLHWLSGRSPRVSGQPADFCTDPVSLLGFALALRHSPDAENEWLHTACTTAAQHFTDWQLSLLGLAERVLGKTCNVASPEILVLAHSKHLTSDDLSQEGTSRVISELRATKLPELDDSQAAIMLAALRHIEERLPTISPKAADIQDVVALLSALPRGLQRWTWEDSPKTATSQARKWHIDHEYHVQNLVWLLLSPIFPDAKYEENTNAVGTVHPRLDIVLPSLRLIVEIKFWRKKDKQEKIIRELAEDASLYFTAGSQYNALVPFIWDEAARTEEHSQLVSALKSIDPIVDVVVVSRPAKMKEP